MKAEKQFLRAYHRFENKYGLVDQKPGAESQNSLVEHALFLMAANNLGFLDSTIINHTLDKVKKYELKPGLYSAWPGDRTKLVSTDDYHALAVISTICDPNISKKILRRVRSRFWYQNNTPQWDWRSFFFFYQHQLIAMHKVASGKGLSWMDKQWIKLVIAHTDSQQDSRKLTSMLRFVVGGIDKDLDRRFKKWEDAYRNEQPLGLGETLHEYYNKRPDEEVHPNRYWLRQYFGRRK